MPGTVRSRISAVLLCFALLVMAAPNAAAASTDPSVGLLRRLLPHGHLVSLAPTTLNRILSGSLGHAYEAASFQLPAPGSPYRTVGVIVFKTEKSTILAFATGRLVIQHHRLAGIESHIWAANLPPSDIRFGKDLRSLAIHTGTDLGGYGSVNMRLTSSKRPRTQTFVCHKTGKKIGSFTETKGSLEGALTFAPGVSVLPAQLTATSVRVDVASLRRTGGCPGRHHHCTAEKWFQASDDSGNTLRVSRDTGMYDVVHISVSGRVQALSLIDVSPPERGALTHHHGALRIQAPNPPSLLDGSLTFVPADWSSVADGVHCSISTDGYDWYGGTLTARFDTGDVRLHGSALEGRLIRRS